MKFNSNYNQQRKFLISWKRNMIELIGFIGMGLCTFVLFVLIVTYREHALFFLLSSLVYFSVWIYSMLRLRNIRNNYIIIKEDKIVQIRGSLFKNELKELKTLGFQDIQRIIILHDLKYCGGGKAFIIFDDGTYSIFDPIHGNANRDKHTWILIEYSKKRERVLKTIFEKQVFEEIKRTENYG